MKSMSSNNINDSNKNSDNWLGFSLSPHSSEATHPSPSNLTAFFNYQNIYYNGGVEPANIYGNGGGVYSSFPVIMPLKSDGSLGLMDAITRSQGMAASTTPKLENFFGGVTMGTPGLDTSTMYYHQNYHIQPQHYQDYSSGLYPTVQQEPKVVADSTCGLYLPCINGESWISNSYGSVNGDGLQSLRLSMSPGCSQSSSCVTVSQHQITHAATNVTEDMVMDTKKRGALKVNQHKQIVHRKSLDTFGQRTSQYRGVTRHRWTGRYEAHLWDNSCKKEGQTRKGRQVYLGGYDMEEKAARAYDLAALKYWGPSTNINFPVQNYEQELEEMKNMSRQEYVAHLRRRSSGFSRGASIYRGVTRHHQHGRWQSRIGRVAGNKDLYLGTFSTQEDAAEAYDVAAIKFRGTNAVTNFDMTRYDVEKIIQSNTLLTGDLARRTKGPDPTDQWQLPQNGEPETIPTSMPTATTQVRSQIPTFGAWTDA
ncbi:AP2-like ethylene-responsive transcription factor ANT [Bidens hawaiensis]|uniref:AP2-like ethylene-responsive transcription factor ANT n=1 Tax=Bidens hawaiensis TaxID=980011 RepID=UPI00404A4A43